MLAWLHATPRHMGALTFMAEGSEPDRKTGTWIRAPWLDEPLASEQRLQGPLTDEQRLRAKELIGYYEQMDEGKYPPSNYAKNGFPWTNYAHEVTELLRQYETAFAAAEVKLKLFIQQAPRWIQAFDFAHKEISRLKVKIADQADIRYPDLELLAKFAEGKGGRRSNDLIGRGWIKVEVTDEGKRVLSAAAEMHEQKIEGDHAFENVCQACGAHQEDGPCSICPHLPGFAAEEHFSRRPCRACGSTKLRAVRVRGWWATWTNKASSEDRIERPTSSPPRAEGPCVFCGQPIDGSPCLDGFQHVAFGAATPAGSRES
jgi:hypothetical protein